MGHLNEENYERLKRSPRDEAELFEHLKAGCDDCEAFLLQHRDPLLDGTADAVLLAKAPQAADDAKAAETFARIRAPKPDSRRWMLALAAMLLAVLGAALLMFKPRGDVVTDVGIKGAPALTLELQGVVKGDDGALARVEGGKPVPGSGTLLFRYHASDAAAATLVVVRDGKREVLGPVALESGTHDLSRDGELLGLSLAGERGRLVIRLEAVSSAAELEVNVGP